MGGGQGKSNRLGNFIMQLDGVRVVLPTGQRILDNFTYEFNRKDRIGVVGPNGVGKTTFLNVLLGNLPLAAGTIAKGETLVCT